MVRRPGNAGGQREDSGERRQRRQVYFTDHGIEELEERRGDEQVSLAWLAQRCREFVDLNPGFEVAVDRLARWLASAEDED